MFFVVFFYLLEKMETSLLSVDDGDSRKEQQVVEHEFFQSFSQLHQELEQPTRVVLLRERADDEENWNDRPGEVRGSTEPPAIEFLRTRLCHQNLFQKGCSQDLLSRLRIRARHDHLGELPLQVPQNDS